MAEFIDNGVKEIKIGDTVLKLFTENDEKKLKGYQYDSLVFRYAIARKSMAEYERLRYRTNPSKKDDFFDRQADRDIMRFCQILDEAIGEHE